MSLSVRPRRTTGGGRGLATIDRGSMADLGLDSGDHVAVRGRDGGRAVAQVIPTDDEEGTIRLGERLRRSAGLDLDDEVEPEPVEVTSADRVTVGLPDDVEVDVEGNLALYFRGELVGQPVLEGQTLPVALGRDATRGADDREVTVTVLRTEPTDAVVVRDWTKIQVSSRSVGDVTIDDGPAGAEPAGATYADVGGLDDELERVREVVELPLRHPELFHLLGVDPPTGVLLHGPSGTGKTLLAEAIATELDAHIRTISGPQIVSKYYGEAEEQLRAAFEEAAEHEPAIVFIDDLDSIAAGRDAGGVVACVTSVWNVAREPL